MSSKSKRGKNQPRRPAGPPAGTSAQGAGAGTTAPAAEHHDPLEDLIETPPGRSRLAQLFLIFLLIFLLIIFIVPFAFQSALTGSEEIPEITWNHPSQGPVELTNREFMIEKRRFNFLLGSNDVENSDVAATIIYDAVAADAGIEIANSELVAEIDRIVTGSFGGQPESYRQYMSLNHPGGVPGFEDTIRRYMRSRRWGQMIGQLTALADPAEIEELWSEQHVEYAFDYVELAVEDVQDAAREAIPDDAALEAWFGELQEWERTRYNDPERYAADLIYYPVGSGSPTELLAKYPQEEGTDPDEQADDYYNRIFFSRFVRPEPEEETTEETDPSEAEDADGEEGVEDTPEEPESPYLSLDEVRDVALLEAPIYFAMQKWWEELAQREAGGEEIDYEAEASALGLAFLGQDDPLDYEGWSSLEGIGGIRLGSAIRRTQPNERLVGVTAESGALIVGRVTEKVAASLPPFAEIRDRVADAWVEDRAADLALEQLEALHVALVGADGDDEEATDDGATDETSTEDTPEPVVTVTAEEFRAAAEAAGYTVARRDWLDRAGPLTDDPDSAKDAHVFLRGQPALYEFEEGQVAEPSLSGRRTHAYLVRLAGKREVDLARMTPQQFNSYRRRSVSTAQADFAIALLSEEELVRLYDLRWPRIEAFEAEEE